MKTVGIVAEYNPFHNGHAHHIAEAKRMTGADRCIVVLSGDFVQRGAPAVMDKFARTRSALLNGADLVLELPVYYATGGAEYFAAGAVALLDKLGVTDALCFGSECGDIRILSDLAKALSDEPPKFKQELQRQMRSGLTYPQARNLALAAAFPHLTEHLFTVQSPNNILGIEYIKAVLKRQSRIQPYTLARSGAGHHSAGFDPVYSSALAIRESISQKADIRYVEEQVPSSVYELMQEAYGRTFPILPDDLSSLIPYKLLLEREQGYTDYLGIDKSFSDRLSNMLSSYTDFPSFCDELKTKNMTFTRVSRNLLHILLDIRQRDMAAFQKDDYIYYARILGFKKEAEPLLGAIKERSAVPLLSKLADAADVIGQKNGLKLLAADIRSGSIYSLLVQQKFGGHIQNEYQKQIVVM